MGNGCCGCSDEKKTLEAEQAAGNITKHDKLKRPDKVDDDGADMKKQLSVKEIKKRQVKEQKTFKKESLKYHQLPVPGKTLTVPTKLIKTQDDFALAHTPGVVEPCLAISKKPELANVYTSKGRTLACISNGTSVLGLGNLGALASKPELEGKAAIFKQFAGIDCVDLCLDTPDVEQFINCVKFASPSFGAVNLECMRAPDCFEVESALKEIMPIPVFHNDQHGTAVVVLAGLINALELKKKKIEQVKIVINGAGAAGIATYDMLMLQGAYKENIFVCDTAGLIYPGRPDNMNRYKTTVANPTISEDTTFEQVCDKADVLIGLSVADAFTVTIMKGLNPDPIIFALASPEPEIYPYLAKDLRPDCIIATSRPEYENQISSLMVGPYIFRAILDTQSSQVNEDMLLAAVDALAALAKEPVTEAVRDQQPDREFEYGPDYFLPAVMDPRLLKNVTLAVVKVANKSGLAKQPVKDINGYKDYLLRISMNEEEGVGLGFITARDSNITG